VLSRGLRQAARGDLAAGQVDDEWLAGVFPGLVRAGGQGQNTTLDRQADVPTGRGSTVPVAEVSGPDCRSEEPACLALEPRVVWSHKHPYELGRGVTGRVVSVLGDRARQRAPELCVTWQAAP
jgi:hypothetical protein